MKPVIPKKNRVYSITLALLFLPSIGQAKNHQDLNITIPHVITQTYWQSFNQKDDLFRSSQKQLFSFDTPTNNLFNLIQDRYLTIHYSKQEKIKAVYEYGAYGIAYEQNW